MFFPKQLQQLAGEFSWPIESTCMVIFPRGSMGLKNIYTYMYHKNPPNVGKYTIPMDPLGLLYLLIYLNKKSSPIFMGKLPPSLQRLLRQRPPARPRMWSCQRSRRSIWWTRVLSLSVLTQVVATQFFFTPLCRSTPPKTRPKLEPKERSSRYTGWWFEIFFMFTPNLRGNDSHVD